MIMKGELARATITSKQAHSMLSCLGHSNCPTMVQGDAMKGVTPSAAPNPTVPKEFNLDDIQGQRLYHTEGHHSSLWDLQYSWQHRCLRVLYVGPCTCWASMRPPAAYLHCTDCHIWRVTTRLLPHANLRNLSAHPIVILPRYLLEELLQPTRCCWCFSKWDPRRVCPWPQERLDPGGIELPVSRGVAQVETWSGQEAAGKMGTPVCPVTWTWKRCP